MWFECTTAESRYFHNRGSNAVRPTEYEILSIAPERCNFFAFDGWGDSYAAFSYSYNDKDVIIEYIKGQKEHHRKLTFAEEYREFLRENGVTPDEIYFLRD